MTLDMALDGLDYPPDVKELIKSVLRDAPGEARATLLKANANDRGALILWFGEMVAIGVLNDRLARADAERAACNRLAWAVEGPKGDILAWRLGRGAFSMWRTAIRTERGIDPGDGAGE